MMKKVMLAANEQPNLDELVYPVLASGKIDGVRICIQDGKCVAGRSLKPSINKFVIDALSDPIYEGLDGELTLAGEDWNNFNKNQSVVMTKSGKPPALVFHVFDDMSDYALTKQAVHRKEYAKQHVEAIERVHAEFHPDLSIRFCQQVLVHNSEDLRKMYDDYRALGYEGLIVMSPTAYYKHGRSTLKQQIMLKLKPSEDSEAIIIGVEELMHNTDAGNSKCQENLVPGGVMGKLKVDWYGKVFYIGTGFDWSTRKAIWENKDQYIGKLCKFKYMELSQYGVPRSPVFVGMRSLDDLGE